MEHRSASRARSVLKAEIRYNDGLMSLSCLVRDISDTGARLELDGDLALPDHFDLHIDKKHVTHRAMAKWRHGREMGVAFADASPPPAEAGLSARVAKLEGDVAELRRLLERIAGVVAPKG